MPSFCSRLWTLGLVVGLIAGCGGGSGGNNTGGGGGSSTTVTFTFVFDSAPTVAARIGSGSFAPVTLSSNTLTLSIPQGTTDFAVAYLCPAYPYFVNGIQYSYNDQYVIEASTQDQTSFTESCPVPTSVRSRIVLTPAPFPARKTFWSKLGIIRELSIVITVSCRRGRKAVSLPPAATRRLSTPIQDPFPPTITRHWRYADTMGKRLRAR